MDFPPAHKEVEDKTKTTKEDDHALVLQQFVDAEDSTISSRDEAVNARRYYDGHQWTDEEVAELEKRGQPVITDNKIKDKIEYLLGLERKTRADPKAYPRNNPSDEPAAEAATDALRYVADDNLFHYVRSDLAENMFVEGPASCEIVVDKAKRYGKRGAIKVCVRHIRWDRAYADPHSFKCDYSDASFKGFITWMDYEEAKANEKWADRVDKIEACFEAQSSQSQATDDKPRFVVNTSNRKRVQVFTHYYRKNGVWYYCVFVKGGFLEDPVKSPYEDEHGEPDCPIEMQAMYRDGEDGSPYGAIRRYKDLQDDWNKRRSKSLHLLNTNQVEGERGAFEDIEETRREAARPDGVVLRTPGMLGQINRGLDLAQGHIQLMQLTGQALDATGPNAALAGQSGNISGRAKQLDQQGGSIAIDKPFDSIRYLTLRIYRHIWNRIVQYWDEETWIRVRDDEQLKFVALNRRRMRGDIIAEELKTAQIPDEEKAAILQMVAANPIYQQEIVQNNVAEMDVDITIDESPDVVTLQQEQFANLVDLAKSGAVQIPAKALIEASSLRNKRKIMDSMNGGNDPAAQAMAQLEMKLKNLGALELEANIRKIMSEVAKNEATATESQIDGSVKVAEFTDPAQPATPKTQVSVN